MVSPFDVFLALPVLFIGGTVVLIIVLAVVHQRHERRRAEEFAQVASFLQLRHEPGVQKAWTFNWSWRPSTPGAILPTLHDSLAPFRTGRGGNRRAENLMEGTYRGHEVKWCEYKFVVSSGKSSHTVTYGVAMVRLPSPWPELSIVPEGLHHKFGQLFGGDDIDFESEEFSARHWVKAEDRKFAYDVLHPRSMEHVDSVAWQRWHVLGEWVCLWEATRPSPNDVQASLDAIIGFIQLAPSFRRPSIRRVAVPS